MIKLLDSLVSPITNIFAKREERKKETKLKQIDRLKSADDSLAEWEAIQAEGGKHSWKDEFWTIVLAIPLILCFIPDMVSHVKAGFDALKDMPDFYQYWLGVAVLASFGVRLVKR